MIRHPEAMVVEERHAMRGGAGAVRIRHYFKADELRSPLRLLAELVLEPGCSIGLHRHEREEEIFIAVAGSGEVSAGDGVWSPVRAGDAVLTGDGESHAVRATSERLVMVAVIGRYPG
jgi:quercetin dioxygenase-like cupin family protein